VVQVFLQFITNTIVPVLIGLFAPLGMGILIILCDLPF